MEKFLFRLIVLIFLLGFTELSAQEVISSSGGDAKGQSVQLSWTIGEPVIATFSGGPYILTQGMHQGDLVVTISNEISGLSFQISAYPNPADKFLKLDINTPDLEGLSYSLFNVDGRLLEQKDIETQITTIPMEIYSPSSFLLKVMSGNKEIKSFKIVKRK